MPKMRGEGVEALDIDPPFEANPVCCEIDKDEWEHIFQQLPVSSVYFSFLFADCRVVVTTSRGKGGLSQCCRA